MQHIIVDLEFTPVEDWNVRQHLEKEIIEIGAVRLDENYEYVDSFDMYVQPEFTHISKNVNNLTGINRTDIIDSPSFEDALDKFTDWIGSEKFRIYEWSENDKAQIVCECKYKEKQTVLCNKHWRDIQRIYARVFHKSHIQSLESAMAELAIEFDGTMHRACDDAKNTATLLQIMAVKEKYIEATQPIKDVLEAPKQGSSLGDLLRINLSDLYALCEN